MENVENIDIARKVCIATGAISKYADVENKFWEESVYGHGRNFQKWKLPGRKMNDQANTQILVLPSHIKNAEFCNEKGA